MSSAETTNRWRENILAVNWEYRNIFLNVAEGLEVLRVERGEGRCNELRFRIGVDYIALNHVYVYGPCGNGGSERHLKILGSSTQLSCINCFNPVKMVRLRNVNFSLNSSLTIKGFHTRD